MNPNDNPYAAKEGHTEIAWLLLFKKAGTRK